ncbi:vWA domain-containing protein [Enterococcus sp. AZ192]|uniref:vWA domain-containing protein n=1 Tax=unclassified Enterococcus TaxID=2608891 RepID=UPI003D2B90C2
MKKGRRKKLRFFRWMMIVASLIGLVYFAQSALLYTNAPIKAALKTDLQPGEVKLSKTAKPVEGMVNQWDITVRIEGRNQFPPPPTDIVLIIDTSGSMEENDRMIKAKSAAEKFVNMVLHKDYVNRIALVTYNSTVTNYTFNQAGWSDQFVDYAHKSLLIDKIKELEPVVNGGTFTQAGIKSATEVMAKATGEKRNIVLISDGVPTYSYPPTAPYNQLSGMELFDYPSGAAGYNYYESVKTIPEANFDYSKPYGNGAKYRIGAFAPEYEQMPTGSKNRLMANHAHSAIAQATITKNEKMSNGDFLVTDFYTIGVDLDSASQDDEIKTGNQTLKEIASSEDKCFAATADNLDDILSGIAGEIVGAIKSAHVVDPMGTGFVMNGSESVTQGNSEAKDVLGVKTINWDVGTLKTPVSNDPDEDVMYAEMTYRVDATNDVLKPNVIDTNGLAKTNGKTTIVYKRYDDTVIPSEFEVPSVKPIIVSLQKKLLDEDGKEVTEKSDSFDFKYGNDQYTGNDTFTLFPTEVKKIVHPWKASQEYTIEELLKSTQDYETQIEINGQVTAGTKDVFKFDSVNGQYTDQQIIVTNTRIAQIRKVYLNIRQAVNGPNEELVIPSKGYFTSDIENTDQTSNIISKSTTKDTPAEVSESLFMKYELMLKKGETKVSISDIIPEYYQFAGYIVSSTNQNLNTTHISSNTSGLMKTNKAELDYQTNEEYWLTMFITPKLGTTNDGEKETSPRPYSWAYKVNQFGQ